LVNELASSNSDKSFHFKKQSSHFLHPIVENIAKNEDLNDEQVDYESGESSQATDMPFIEPGSGILSLVVPSSRQEQSSMVINADGSQPDVECTQEEPASQVDNPIEEEGGQQAMQIDAPARRSSSTDNQGNTSTRVADKAKAAAEKKDLSGTSLNTSNSFAILDDDDIIARALEMVSITVLYLLKKCTTSKI
jgi:hypothetical protein